MCEDKRASEIIIRKRNRVRLNLWIVQVMFFFDRSTLSHCSRCDIWHCCHSRRHLNSDHLIFHFIFKTSIFFLLIWYFVIYNSTLHASYLHIFPRHIMVYVTDNDIKYLSVNAYWYVENRFNVNLKLFGKKFCYILL